MERVNDRFVPWRKSSENVRIIRRYLSAGSKLTVTSRLSPSVGDVRSFRHGSAVASSQEMPSPIGHALGGIAAGAAVSGRAGWGSVLCFAALGAMPDADFLLPIPHRGPTHSLGSAVLIFLVTWPTLTWRRPAGWQGVSAVRLALAIAAAWGSHTLLDWLGADSSTPRGVMAFWPLATTYHVSGFDIFHNISRRYWLPEFWRVNTVAALREVTLVGPVAALCAWFARRAQTPNWRRW